jgi:hypothetical protein
VGDGLWHVVRVTRRHRRLLLKVDNHRPARGRAHGRDIARVRTDGHVWLGGFREGVLRGRIMGEEVGALGGRRALIAFY